MATRHNLRCQDTFSNMQCSQLYECSGKSWKNARENNKYSTHLSFDVQFPEEKNDIQYKVYSLMSTECPSTYSGYTTTTPQNQTQNQTDVYFQGQIPCLHNSTGGMQHHTFYAILSIVISCI